MTVAASKPDVSDDAGYGEILGDLDVRDLRAKARLTEDDELELILGDGDCAVRVTMSWTKDIETSADTVEQVGSELHSLAVLLRERAERKKRPLPGAAFPEMGILPTQ